jgi:hypothetical protein
VGDGEFLEEGQFLHSITFELTWEDEDDYQPFLRPWENQPDQFTLEASQEGNFTKTATSANSHGSEGQIILTFEFSHDNIESMNGTGEWEVELTMDSCGDHESPTGVLTQPDNSNGYELTVTTRLYMPE